MKKLAVLALLLSFAALGMSSAPAAMAATSAGATRVSATRVSAPAAAVTAHTVKIPRRAETSSWVVYSQTSMTGTSKDINGCGTHNRPFPVRSYRWIARGQSGRMYNCFKASCAVNAILGAGTNASSPNPVGWESIFIVC